ncbi:MAG: cobalamin B12-binding domain-containing protein [Pseudomonadota bacterium]
MGDKGPAWEDKPMNVTNARQAEAQILDAQSDTSATTFVELCHALAHKSETNKRVRNTTHLFQTIKGEILPRLMLLHSGENAADTGGSQDIIRAADLEQFVQIILEDGTTRSGDFVANLMARGVRAETVFTNLLSPTARRLGELWEEDACTFTEVTIGLCRLHQTLREHGIENQPYRPKSRGLGSKRVLLCNAEGDQHVFGLLIVAEFLRRDDWRVWCEPGLDNHALTDLVATKSFDVVGLSATHSDGLESVAKQIRNLRNRSRNPDLVVMIGGAALAAQPDRVAEIGADGYAADAETASAICRQLLEDKQLHC